MNSDIGICGLVVKRGKTDEKRNRYMQHDDAKETNVMQSAIDIYSLVVKKEAKLMKSAIGICSLVVKKRQTG